MSEMDCISGDPQMIFVVTGNNINFRCGQNEMSNYVWVRCRGNNMVEIGSRHGKNIHMSINDRRFQIFDKLFISEAVDEFNGLYVCYSEGKVLTKIQLVVRQVGKIWGDIPVNL